MSSVPETTLPFKLNGWADRINPVRNRTTPAAPTPRRSKELSSSCGRPALKSERTRAAIGANTIGFSRDRLRLDRSLARAGLEHALL